VIRYAATAIAVTMFMAACAAQPGAPAPGAARSSGHQCFLARQVNGFSPVSDNIVDIQVGANRYFRLTLDGFCPDTAFRTRVALRTLTGGSWICQDLDAEIIVPDPTGGQRCLVRGIQPITRADWLAGGRQH
jgi:Family of unknown function (DUF6491)